MDAWVQQQAERIAARAARDLEALVAVSSPSGDRHGAEDCVAVVRALAPDSAALERVPCSSGDHAEDVVVRLRGSGRGRLLLLGHLDTVVPHERHAALHRDDGRLVGSGSVDMKGGDVLALGLLRALAEGGAGVPSFAEVALLLVVDEEWRTGPMIHVERFAGWDGCLCFEAGELAPDGSDAVIVRRKAAGTLRVHARGVAAHAGAAPDKGRNALLALAAARAGGRRRARAGRARPPHRGPDDAPLRRRLQRRARRRRADLRPALRPHRRLRRAARRAPARARRRRARRADWRASGRRWTPAPRPRRCWPRPASCSAAR